MTPGTRTALILAPLLAFAGCTGGIVLLAGALDQQSTQACSPGPGLVVAAVGVPDGAVAGYADEQLSNAALIVNAGAALGLSQRDQTIGVMTAMGESGLRILTYGDAVGPDSRGLFQQRDNGAWGSLSDRLDPTTSATNFFRVLADLPGRDGIAPTTVAHRVQRNADPNHYTRYWDAAVAVMTALASPGSASPSAGPADLPASPDVVPAAVTLACGDAGTTLVAPAGITATGWTAPAAGPFTSGYGMRTNPVTGDYRLHGGIDLAPGCGDPIYAAADGTVVRAGPAASYGNLVVLDHGAGLTTYYAHMHTGDILVSLGQQVPAGTQIARVGTAGNSTGCHLHFEVRDNGARTDPAPFLTDRGITLGALR